MSSRAESSKVRNIRVNPRAAILVHEDEKLDNPVSLTLLGNIDIPEGQSAETLRALHLHKHPQRAQFIQGEDIAILVFIPERAILADRKGQVIPWER